MNRSELRSLCLGVFLISGSLILYELLLTRPCVWLDANADVLCLVLTNAFVVPTISAHTQDGQAPYHG